MADTKGDPTKQPPECKPDKGSGNKCPNLKCYEGWDLERYTCDVCGEWFTLYYDEMR